MVLRFKEAIRKPLYQYEVRCKNKALTMACLNGSAAGFMCVLSKLLLSQNRHRANDLMIFLYMANYLSCRQGRLKNRRGRGQKVCGTDWYHYLWLHSLRSVITREGAAEAILRGGFCSSREGCAECCGNVCFRPKRTFSRSLYKQSLYFRKRP